MPQQRKATDTNMEENEEIHGWALPITLSIMILLSDAKYFPL